MPEFDWNIPLPLRFGATPDAPLTLARAIPGERQRNTYEALSLIHI